MTEDYDVLSMSENDYYVDTDASIDDSGVAGSDDNSGLSEADCSDISGVESLPSTESRHEADNASAPGARDVDAQGAPNARREETKGPKRRSRASGNVFDPIASCETLSMYRLPRMSAEPLGRTDAEEDADEKRPGSEPDKDWQLSYLETRGVPSRVPALVIAVFGTKENLVRAVIDKLLPVIPKARFLWVCTTSDRELVASEYTPASKSFNHEPNLPTKRQIKKQQCKLVDIFTYDTEVKDSADLKHQVPKTESTQTPRGKHWDRCPAAPVVPVTTTLLGTNELNEKARILASLDAPLLRSPEGIYTPLTLDYLHMLDANMLLAMNSNGTVACMTTPSKATMPALWPASLLPVTVEKKKEKVLLKSLPFWIPMVLTFSSVLFAAYLLYLQFCNSEPPVPAPGPQDLQVWEPKTDPKAFLSSFFINTPQEYIADNNGLSTAVSGAVAVLFAYIRYLYLEVKHQVGEIQELMMLYGEKGRILVNEALGSELVGDTKQYAKLLGRDFSRKGKHLWETLARDDASQRVKGNLANTADFGKQASRKVAKYVAEVRDSETVANTVNFAKDSWSNCIRRLREAAS